MTYQLQYFDEVETDLHQAKVWYKEQKEGLEIEFANVIEKTIKHIYYRQLPSSLPAVMVFDLNWPVRPIASQLTSLASSTKTRT